MKNTFTLTLLILLFCSSNLYSQKICGSLIVIKTVKSDNDTINDMNNRVAEMLHTGIIEAPNCDLFPMNKLGELGALFEQIPPETCCEPSDNLLSKFFSERIDYVALVETKMHYISELEEKGGKTKITFYSTSNIFPKIEMNLVNSYDVLMLSPAVVQKRFNKCFQPIINCERLDSEILKAKKDLVTLKFKYEELIGKRQLELCDSLNYILRTFENSTKRNKKKNKEVLNFLESQHDICEKLKPMLKKLDLIKFNLEKFELQKQKEEFNKSKEAKKRMNREEQSNDKLLTDDLNPDKSSGEKLLVPCLGNGKKPYYLIGKMDFEKKYGGEIFIRFAVLPRINYNPCDFAFFYQLGCNGVYLVSRIECIL